MTFSASPIISAKSASNLQILLPKKCGNDIIWFAIIVFAYNSTTVRLMAAERVLIYEPASRYPTIDRKSSQSMKWSLHTLSVTCCVEALSATSSARKTRKRWKNFTLKWYTAESQRHVNGAIFQYSRDSVMFLARHDKRLFHLRLRGRGVVTSKALWVAVTALELHVVKNLFICCHDAFNSSLMKVLKVSIATEKSWKFYVHLGHCRSIKCQYLSRILNFKVGQTFLLH